MGRFRYFLWVTLLALLVACTAPTGPLYEVSPDLPRYDQSSFQEYVSETQGWVKANRYFLTSDRDVELAVNTPFERLPSVHKPSRGILLVHGLGDSPGYFEDIADALADRGFLVRAMLLPGHGTKPADLMLPQIDDWRIAVAHQVELLAQEVDEVWLGGFSTGANLVTAHALKNGGVSGLLLFSPGYVPKDKMLALSPMANMMFDWLDIDEPTQNYMRYESLSANAAELYYRTTKEVRSLLTKRGLNIPALVVMSRDDSVIDPDGVLELFEQYFTAPSSSFIWYGQNPGSEDERVVVKSARIPEQRVSNFSHMSVMFAPDNPYYGRDGSFLMLENGQTSAPGIVSRDQLWFSAYGYNEPGKYHARLTWNPYFDELLSAMKDVIDNQSSRK